MEEDIDYFLTEELDREELNLLARGIITEADDFAGQWLPELRDSVRVAKWRGGVRPYGMEPGPSLRARNATSGLVRSRAGYLQDQQTLVDNGSISYDTPSWLMEARQRSRYGRPPYEFLEGGDPGLSSFAPEGEFKWAGPGRTVAIYKRIPTRRSAKLAANVPQPNYASLADPEFYDRSGIQYWLCAPDFKWKTALVDSGMMEYPEWTGPTAGKEEGNLGTQVFYLRLAIRMRGESDNKIPGRGRMLTAYHPQTRSILTGIVQHYYTYNRSVGYIEVERCRIRDVSARGRYVRWEKDTKLKRSSRTSKRLF